MRLSIEKIGLVLALAFVLVPAVGCGKDSKKSERSKGSGTAPVDLPPGGSTEDTDLGVKPLAFGAYLAADLAPAGAEVGVEFGTIYMRKQKFVGAGDTFDFRWRQVTAFGTTGFLPQKASTGCAEAAFAAPASSQATAVSVSGAWTDGLVSEGTVFRSQDVKEEKTIIADGVVKAAVTLASGPVEVSSPPMPSDQSILKLSGAFDLNFGTNLQVADLNSNLATAKNDLKISFTRKVEKENLAIITFFGGTQAKTKVLRCFIAPNGNVLIPAATYKNLLPLRGMLGVFANVQAKAENGVTAWTSAIYGSGILDQSVP